MFDMKLQLRVLPVFAVALCLAGCGGGSGNGSSESPSATAQSTPAGGTTQAPAQTYTDWSFSGSAPSVTGAGGKVAVLFVPDTLNSHGVSGTDIDDDNAALAGQVQQSNYGGAFTTFASSSVGISLTKGSTIADINGTGGYIAIGRWTHGSDSSGGNYNENEGAHYAVGTPLTLTRSTGTLSCSLLMATSPTSVSGSVAPGSLKTATATLDLASLNLQNFAATVAIGADTSGTIAQASMFADGESFVAGGTFFAHTVGTDSTKPLVVIAYGAKLPNTGDINGLMVLSCK